MVVATVGESVVSNRVIDASTLMPCNFEEADERIFVHLKRALSSGEYNRFIIKTVDSDVVIIGIAVFFKLQVEELWIEFGAGKSLKFIPIHEVARSLGPDKAYALPFFHAFSGCDTTSSMSGKGKKAFFDTWNVLDKEVTPVFTRLSLIDFPHDITDLEMEAIEKYVVCLYSKTKQGKFCLVETVGQSKTFRRHNKHWFNIF